MYVECVGLDVGGPFATATGTTADDESRFFFFSLIFHRSRLDLYVDLSLILISCLCVCVDLGQCWSMCEEGHNSLCIDALALTEDHTHGLFTQRRFLDLSIPFS